MSENTPLLTVRNLGIAFDLPGGTRQVTEGVSYSINPGEIVALVGESGSGKTLTGLANMLLLPRHASLSGQIFFDGREISSLPLKQLRALYGKEIAAIYQEPLTAMNPVYSVEQQLAEALHAHHAAQPIDVDARIDELLEMASLSDTAVLRRRFPHELSGGQRQRVMIAVALAWQPRLLIADEPTTALDVTTQAEVLELLRDLSSANDMALLFITHDMGVVADIADRVLVMHNGRLVEEGLVDRVFYDPQDDYTKSLLAAVAFRKFAPAGERDTLVMGQRRALTETPAFTSGAAETRTEPALSVTDLRVVYPGRTGTSIRKPPGVLAVDGVSLVISPGENLGLVGESGSGKSTVAKAILGITDITDGSVRIDGEEFARQSQRRRRAIRQHIGAVFQDPGASLNPRSRLWRCVTEPLWRHGLVRNRNELRRRAAELFDMVAIPSTWGDRYPHELSGGQRQRVCIARALALSPSLLVADEPTSALDVSVQARVLDLLRGLQAELGFASLFISHDLFTVGAICDRVAVMKKGKIVETNETKMILANPSNEYTQLLLAAAPVADPHTQRSRRRDAANDNSKKLE